MLRRLLALLVIALCLSSASCGDDDNGPGKPEPCAHHQTSEDAVLNLMLIAYRMQSLDCYMELLAADFRFFPDPVTRSELKIDFWTRTEDSLATALLFGSAEVKSVVVELDWPAHSAVNAGFLAPFDGWTRLFLNNVLLDVEIEPLGQETTTYRVENQRQRFYFRRGRTNPASGPADTLVYLVQWHDEGPSEGKSNRPNAVVPTTWSSIKAGLLN